MLTRILGGTDAFVWECIPISQQTLHKTTFKFAVKPSEVLKRIPCDRQSFMEHFKSADDKLVTSFQNLGGDSLLVTPVSDFASFNHISSFHRLASVEEKSTFWQHVGECMKSFGYQLMDLVLDGFTWESMRDRNITVSIRSESSQSLNDLFRSTLELVEDIQEKHYIGTLFFLSIKNSPLWKIHPWIFLKN